MGRPRQKNGAPAAKIAELLPGAEWIARQGSYDDGDTWPVCPGRMAEYDYDRGGLIVTESGKEIGFIPVSGGNS